jgi:hypothetical protein
MSADTITQLPWNRIHDAAPRPGIYSWYYEPYIGDYDVDKTISDVLQLRNQNDLVGAAGLLRSFLQQNLFSYFRQDAYQVELKGPLKPRHVGVADHDQDVSASVIERLLEDPERLRPLRDVLKQSTPYFASPLYVGMSDCLRTRLLRHKHLIHHFRSQSGPANPENSPADEEAGFAQRVAHRRIPPDRLFVVTCEIPSVGSLNVDAENLLNRMFYPILGRN